MNTTDHATCRRLVSLLARKGVRRVVLSPGSRNAPLLVAFAREQAIRHYVVVDERIAAFMALGMATRTDEPVALVCTSGTALLNYAPAVAEAYYRHIPLIVISADRPEEWIDQDDSQTIRQRGVLSAFVKGSYQLPVGISGDMEEWYAVRTINDALCVALTPCKAPVHINVPLCEPLCGTGEYHPEPVRVIDAMQPAQLLSHHDVETLSAEWKTCGKVMILATFLQPSVAMSDALKRLAMLPQVVVLTESVANLCDDRFIPTIDRVITAIGDSEKDAFAPDLLVSVGGAPISRMVKEFLRRYKPKAHWRIGNEEHIIDTMQCLTRKISADPAVVLGQLSERLQPVQSDYAALWKGREAVAAHLHDGFIADAPWCDLKAFSILLPAIPAGTSLHLSNGTSVRYAQLFHVPQVSSVYCNRGVSGIDGSTSTALGASCVEQGMTLLITGDMSFGYDIGALITGYQTPRFKVVVINNGGGGIFRFIQGTSYLPELEECFEVRRRLPLQGYAELHGFRFFRADSEAALREVLPRFFAETAQPALLSVDTPNEVNATVLRAYMLRARVKSV